MTRQQAVIRAGAEVSLLVNVCFLRLSPRCPIKSSARIGFTLIAGTGILAPSFPTAKKPRACSTSKQLLTRITQYKDEYCTAITYKVLVSSSRYEHGTSSAMFTFYGRPLEQMIANTGSLP